MILKHFKPTTPSSRNTSLPFLKGLRITPLKSKTKGFVKTGGRNNSGKITVRHRGGGHKRSHRKINFISNFDSAIVEQLEYDPNRSAKIARLFSAISKDHFYVLAPDKLEVGYFLKSSLDSNYSLGSSDSLRNLPLGTLLHCIGTNARMNKGILQRASGTFGQLIQKGERYSTVRLSSGENKKLLSDTLAVVGPVSNPQNQQKNLGKAGRKRWKGIRPTVRGVAMNPVDHPHGGGEGKSSGGRASVTPWAKPVHGRKTRKKKKN